jgi:hypothetical protein
MTKAQVKEAIAKGQSFFFGSGDTTMEEAQETIAAFAELLAEATPNEFDDRFDAETDPD